MRFGLFKEIRSEVIFDLKKSETHESWQLSPMGQLGVGGGVANTTPLDGSLPRRNQEVMIRWCISEFHFNKNSAYLKICGSLNY